MIKKLSKNWEKTCKYLKDNDLISDISFNTWITPLKLIACEGDCLVFSFIDAKSYVGLDNTINYTIIRYGQVIADAYNSCTGENIKRIDIRN
ncbi:MAG: hypothetical protein ACI4E1_07325 [Lachnospira sp.]